MKKKLLYFTLILFLVACGNSNQVNISGTIADAEDETLYLEENNLLGINTLDSIKLSKDGSFKFKLKTPENPELYQLRLKNKRVILVVDSTQKIEVIGQAGDIATAEIRNSKASESIQQLRQSIKSLQDDFDAIADAKDETTKEALTESFIADLDKHKSKVKADILTHPESLASYYALFQQISETYIFTPYDRADRPYYQAVATAFVGKYPESGRSKSLYDLVINVLRDEKANNKEIDWSEVIDTKELGFIELELQDKHGYPKKLSDLTGSLILLDFMVYGVENSMNHTFALRELYDAYNDRGLKIYQVSLDENRAYWERSISAIPWICVIDETGRSAGMYNIQEVPSSYLIDKTGNIIGKFSDLESLESAIQRNL